MELETSRDELDLPREYGHYRDEGCEFAVSCLDCQLSKCVYDEPGGRQHWLKGQRDGEIVRLFYVEGKGVMELGLRFGISQRTVQRALKNYLLSSASRSPFSLDSLGDGAKNAGKLEGVRNG